jgi:hypothetical protein
MLLLSFTVVTLLPVCLSACQLPSIQYHQRIIRQYDSQSDRQTIRQSVSQTVRHSQKLADERILLSRSARIEPLKGSAPEVAAALVVDCAVEAEAEVVLGVAAVVVEVEVVEGAVVVVVRFFRLPSADSR